MICYTTSSIQKNKTGHMNRLEILLYFLLNLYLYPISPHLCHENFIYFYAWKSFVDQNIMSFSIKIFFPHHCIREWT